MGKRGRGGAEVEMSASMTKSTTCRYEPDCRHHADNKVTKKSRYCSMENRWRGLVSTAYPCKYSSSGLVSRWYLCVCVVGVCACTRAHNCDTRRYAIQGRMFCSTRPAAVVSSTAKNLILDIAPQILRPLFSASTAVDINWRHLAKFSLFIYIYSRVNWQQAD